MRPRCSRELTATPDVLLALARRDMADGLDEFRDLVAAVGRVASP